MIRCNTGSEEQKISKIIKNYKNPANKKILKARSESKKVQRFQRIRSWWQKIQSSKSKIAQAKNSKIPIIRMKQKISKTTES